MNSLIIYGSNYGTTKEYAEKFSKMANIPVISYKNINKLTDYSLFCITRQKIFPKKRKQPR